MDLEYCNLSMKLIKISGVLFDPFADLQYSAGRSNVAIFAKMSAVSQKYLRNYTNIGKKGAHVLKRRQDPGII